ncbi:MAG: hypothetical protein RL346_2175 [Verrucomicrobiota bacterium]|jgi:uncharacterized protein (DUF58 family)
MSVHLPETQYLDPEVLQNIGDLELIAREIVQGLRAGGHRSNLRGFSTEFAHHRQYSPGDPIRSIDWRVYGRTEKYFTKLYEAETNFDCHILVDSSASMTYGSGKVSKLEYAKFLAASIAYMVLKQRDSVGLSVFDSEVRAYMPPRSSMNVILEIDRLLRVTQPIPKTTIAKQLHDIAMLAKRRSFVVLISDLFSDVDDIMAGLDYLKFGGHNIVVIQTLDPYELEFPFKGTWRFEGLEGEDPLTTETERMKDAYLSGLGQFLETMRTRCMGSGIDFTTADTKTPLDVLLAEIIHKRENLGGSAPQDRS